MLQPTDINIIYLRIHVIDLMNNIIFSRYFIVNKLNGFIFTKCLSARLGKDKRILNILVKKKKNNKT